MPAEPRGTHWMGGGQEDGKVSHRVQAAGENKAFQAKASEKDQFNFRLPPEVPVWPHLTSQPAFAV